MSVKTTTGAPAEERIACGVAGWSYDDWRDTVYRVPCGLRQPSLFGAVKPEPQPVHYPDDELRFLAQFVDMIEINSSFYRIPSTRTVASWSERVRDIPRFFFTAKLNRVFTHKYEFDSKLAGTYRQAFVPLREAGLLRGILAQFRYDFSDTAESRALITWIQRQLGGFAPLVVEVRHKSWEGEGAVSFFRDLGVDVACLDYPTARDSFDPSGLIAGRRGYLRLHGRNRQAWFSKDVPVHETYNYDYSDDEIRGLAVRGRELLEKVPQLTIVANNHYQGKAVSAALRLKAELLERKVPVPPALLSTYPGLTRVASE
ncbi:MAG: DUF72 domain-containing protein [Candidatus Pacebacteria bacterium]|nr:DUF72 domain-containing protein [Candidatus Paceibacterota bacterium]